MADTRWNSLLRMLERRATPILALLLIGMVYFLGIRSERTGFVDEVLDPGLKRITHPVLNAFRGKPERLSRLVLLLGDPELDSLRSIQERALTNGWLDPEENAVFAIQMQVGERRVQASIHMQEGPVDRSLHPRWPFTMRTADSDTLLGMRQFDLMPIRDAMPQYGLVMRAAMDELGIPAFHHQLVELELNGKDLGLYHMEGRTDSLQLVHWGMGKGPVLRFDDALHKHVRRTMDTLHFPAGSPMRAEWLSAPILASRTLMVPDGPARSRNAIGALENFRAGRAKASEVFDAELLARFLALSDVLGAHGSTQWWNLRFLADSASGKLVVLPQRILAGNPITSLLTSETGAPIAFPSSSNTLVGRFLSDPAVYGPYISWLTTLSANGWLEGSLAREQEALEKVDKAVRNEYPQATVDRSVFEHCRAVVQLVLHPREAALAYTRVVRPRQRQLAVANVHDLPIVLVSYMSGSDTIPFNPPMVLQPRERDKPISYYRVDVDVPEDDPQAVTLFVSLYGSTERRTLISRSTSIFTAN